MNGDVKKAKNIVGAFVEQKLNGEVTKLAEFDFCTLQNSAEFGCPDYRFDCDDTQIMRAVYVLLWGDIYPDLKLANIGTGKKYRGDTLNTFHTMFGRPIEGREGFFAGLEKYFPADELRQKVRDFSNILCRIGNFAVLPNCSCEGRTLNTHRGCNDWHDFFDRFLIGVYASLCGKSSGDELFDRLMQKNSFFFQQFSGKKGFYDFVHKNFLEDYLDNSESPPHEIYPLNFHWFNVNDREKYYADAAEYVARASDLIRRRSFILTLKISDALAL